MRNVPLVLTVLAGALALGLSLTPGLLSGQAGNARPAPEFPTTDPALWINSPPLAMKDLRGKVLILEVWTYG